MMFLTLTVTLVLFLTVTISSFVLSGVIIFLMVMFTVELFTMLTCKLNNKVYTRMTPVERFLYLFISKYR